MLFYIALFIICVIIAVGFLFLYRSLEDVGKVIYRAFLPTGKAKRAPPPRQKNLTTTVNDTPTPWGWYSKAAAGKAARAQQATPSARTPWGWPGKHHGTREKGRGKDTNGGSSDGQANVPKPERIVNPNVGWPYREEKSELAGKEHKVAREVTPKPTDLSKTSKPWGW